MHDVSRLLSQPEFIHAAINHFPLIGLFVAILATVAGLISRKKSATVIGLGLIGVLALSVWPVVEYGEAGYDRVLSMSDDPGQFFLKQHAALAGRWVFLYYVTAVLAVGGLVVSWKLPRFLTAVSVAALLLATASLAAGIAIAHTGAEVRHREFRTSAPPQ